MKAWLPIMAALVAPAHAADWVAVTIPQSEDRYFYDRSKLVINGPEVTYWKKIVFKQAQKVKERLAASGLMREQIHCTQHTLRLLSFIYHDSAGNVIEYVSEAEKEGAPIIPDTVGDVFEQTLCVTIKPENLPATPLSPTMGQFRSFLNPFHRTPSPVLSRTPPPLAGEGLGERADLRQLIRHG